jgi:glycosyltransferase involved in cell wall biosynthesis
MNDVAVSSSVAILAPNIRAGGGLTHLVELVKQWVPGRFGFDALVVLAPPVVRQMLPESQATFISSRDGNGLMAEGQRWWSLLRAVDCDVLYVPGGAYLGRTRPFVTLSQNLLPFDEVERHRYSGRRRLRLFLLKWIQSRSMRRASGAIFLSEHARKVVLQATGELTGPTRIIPHGIDDRFRLRPRLQKVFSPADPMKLLYVSIVSPYKHQWHVVEAVAQLRASGVPISLTLVGRAERPELLRLEEALDRFQAREFVDYVGNADYRAIDKKYQEADAFVFASSCENLPNIMIEAMAAGLPIASSNKQPMPDILGDAGIYFDPENAGDIAQALAFLAESPESRAQLAARAFEKSEAYSWERCARETFEFLAEVASKTPA